MSLNIFFDFCFLRWNPQGIRLGGLFFFKNVCTISYRETFAMRTSKKKPFTMSERRGKGGSITAIKHSINGFCTLVLSGQCKTLKGISDSSFLKQSIYSIGYDIQHRFPDLFKQGRNSTIFSYSLPVVESRESKKGFRYNFHYILNGGSDIETAVAILLPLIEETNNKIIACMKEDQEE